MKMPLMLNDTQRFTLPIMPCDGYQYAPTKIPLIPRKIKLTPPMDVLQEDYDYLYKNDIYLNMMVIHDLNDLLPDLAHTYAKIVKFLILGGRDSDIRGKTKIAISIDLLDSTCYLNIDNQVQLPLQFTYNEILLVDIVRDIMQYFLKKLTPRNTEFQDPMFMIEL